MEAYRIMMENKIENLKLEIEKNNDKIVKIRESLLIVENSDCSLINSCFDCVKEK